MELEKYEQMFPHVQVDGMMFYTPNTHVKWRIDTLYTKEPDTIIWLNDMKPGEVLYDVGANIGQYSIYAAKRGVKVYAFEPEAQNFAILQKNIFLNKLTNCTAFPICLSDEIVINTLRLSGLIAGGSCHSFGADMDYHGNEKHFQHEQGSIAVPMDYFLAHTQAQPPDHIKIDVDGFEHLVLDGADDCIGFVKTILCEMDSKRKEHMDWMHLLCDKYGFHVDEKQIECARRKDGSFEGIGNIVFYR
ncbi:MAG: methyltransferase [Podoviridae sp. ctQNx1]|nr:MAG: methyltransferase [Podoviridae sp. ctQNx1]UOF78098.1 methyltransferase [Caudoviricetes sp.]